MPQCNRDSQSTFVISTSAFPLDFGSLEARNGASALWRPLMMSTASDRATCRGWPLRRGVSSPRDRPVIYAYSFTRTLTLTQALALAHRREKRRISAATGPQLHCSFVCPLPMAFGAELHHYHYYACKCTMIFALTTLEATALKSLLKRRWRPVMQSDALYGPLV